MFLFNASGSFDDESAKLTALRGNEHVVIAKPDVRSFRIEKDFDFLVLGCKSMSLGDGLFDKIKNVDICF